MNLALCHHLNLQLELDITVMSSLSELGSETTEGQIQGPYPAQCLSHPVVIHFLSIKIKQTMFFSS